jgi:hypothetical protein
MGLSAASKIVAYRVVGAYDFAKIEIAELAIVPRTDKTLCPNRLI